MIRIDPRDFGTALGDARDRAGLSQRALAERIATATGRDVPSVKNQLGSWERGEKSPSAVTLAPLLDALGYDLALIPREDA